MEVLKTRVWKLVTAVSKYNVNTAKVVYLYNCIQIVVRHVRIYRNRDIAKFRTKPFFFTYTGVITRCYIYRLAC